jgi:hypothetical protein
MIASDLNPTLEAHERKIVRRQRYQQGSLQKRQHGKHKMWILQDRDGKTKRYATLGACREMSKSQAEKKRDELAEVSARNSAVPDADITFGSFVEAVALPFCRSKWKQSTTATTESRIRHHLIIEFGEALLRDLRLQDLQRFLNGKSAAGLSKSVVAHLRWDLHQIFKVARAEGYIERDPSQALFTPRATEVTDRPTMTIEEVSKHIAALDQRERVIDHPAIFAGMRPGEILGLKRRHVSKDGTQIIIKQRV